MSTELAISTDRVQKFIDDLEAHKTILSTCTQLFTALTKHFSSLQDSLSQKSQSLDSKFLSLSSTSSQTLESLSLRESSIPDRESAVTARIETQKESALAEFQNPNTSAQLSESLKSLSRRMDSTGLVKFIVSKRKESVSLRAEISNALYEAVDPPRLVLEAVDDFVSQKIGKTGGLTDKRWACGMLVQALFPDANWKGKKGEGPEFARSIGERAAKVVEKWKGQLDGEGEVVGAAEAVMFLQMVVGFELKERFEEGFLRKLVVDFASRRDMAKLAAALEFGDKMGDIIDELVKNGKEIEAVYFAMEAGLTERFSPVSLLKSYLRNSKKNATTILKNENYSAAATEESNNVELNSIKAIIKCVEDHKLESEFSVDSLRKRATQLEKVKADRRKSSSATGKPQNKRGHNAGSSRGSGPSAFRPAKAAKFSNSYPPFSRRNPASSAQHSPAARYSGPYNYAGQNVFEGPTAPYAAAYGVAHSQSPAAVTQQHYPHPVDNVGAAGYRNSGAFGGQTSYGAYDYVSAPPSAYQPSSYTQ
ncbi:FRIGIDA-like protein [Theobroma cacao]|uniref:FRIGIDA-like protein n=1 Tax=Theobroma cacao TaxID=3641 RepID=A0A061GN61_THECC|nr:FRIGIDA-like protein [Theobroma cacao]